MTQADTTESLYSDRNSSYDNVERRQERVCQTANAINTIGTNTLESRQDRLYECETILDTEDSDTERMERNNSFKERLDPLLCKFQYFFQFILLLFGYIEFFSRCFIPIHNDHYNTILITYKYFYMNFDTFLLYDE
jgi:hypothetical protein